MRLNIERQNKPRSEKIYHRGFSMRLNIERQNKLEPKRYKHAKDKLVKMGFKVAEITSYQMNFLYKGSLVKLYPYSGWHTGKTIKDGRGLNNLIKQLKG